MAELLELEHVAVRLGQITLLRDVSLRVAEGEVVGIVGETGSGKSLTCRVALGLLERIGARIVSGSAHFRTIDLVTANEKTLRQLRGREIALVPQSSIASLDPVIRIGRQLEETIRALDASAHPSERARELLELVHMPRASAVLRSHAHELSGGMRQRVMIALALAGRPALLVADEATTALDVTVQRHIMNLLIEIRGETRMAVLLVTHDLALARELCDSLWLMYAGTTVEAGPVESVFAAPGHPYTEALIACDVQFAQPGTPLSTIRGAHPSPSELVSGCPFSPRCDRATAACANTPVQLMTLVDQERHATACARRVRREI